MARMRWSMLYLSYISYTTLVHTRKIGQISFILLNSPTTSKGVSPQVKAPLRSFNDNNLPSVLVVPYEGPNPFAYKVTKECQKEQDITRACLHKAAKRMKK